MYNKCKILQLKHIALSVLFLTYFVFANDFTDNENVEEKEITSNENNNDEEFFNVVTFLQKYGYLDVNDNEMFDMNNTNEKFVSALKTFQEFYELKNQNGILNAETLETINTPRCGVSDFYQKKNKLYNFKTGWNKSIITWDFLTSNTILIELAKKAFEVWEHAANISFHYTPYTLQYYYNPIFLNSNLLPNILISMGTMKHRKYTTKTACEYDFDGRGGVLGHAFSPNPTLNSVDIHMDNNENWNFNFSYTLNDINTISFFSSLVHEIGHALGLEHIRKKNSVMYAMYKPKYFSTIADFKLTTDDIEAIQNIYGEKEKYIMPINSNKKYIPTETVTVSTATTRKNTNTKIKPDLCTFSDVTKFLVIDNQLFIYYNNWIWIKNFSKKENNLPAYYYLSNWFPFIPKNFNNLTAAYRRPNGNILLVVDNVFYDILWPSLQLNNNRITLPRIVENINGILNTNTGQTYIFYNNNLVMEINECNFNVISNGNIDKYFPGIPTNIEGVLKYINGYIYFFKNNVIYEYSEYTKQVVSAKSFDLSIFDIYCSNTSILKQLKNLVQQLTI